MANRATSDQVALLGDWSVGPGPLFRRLARAVERAIEGGGLGRGDRLASERALAAALGVSRGTAVAAYDLLLAAGLVERRRGSGTYVVGSAAAGLPAGREGSALVARLVDRSAGDDGLVDLSISVLHDATGLPDTGVRAADLRTVAPDTGYSPWGLAPLRARLADLVTAWGLPTAPAELVVTTGAQQAISLAAACWVRPGDVVVVEDPTYPGALAALAAAGAEVVGVPLDGGGVRVDALARALARHPALVYLQPTVHSPTGTLLAPGRRREVARLLGAARVPLVEDHALSGLAWVEAPPPIASFAGAHPTAVVGSLSKLLWGGLRVGFVRAPEPVALRLARVKATHDLGSSVVSQLLAERLLAHPGLSGVLAARAAELRRRYDLLTGLLAAEGLPWTWDEPVGGLSVWVRLPDPVAEPLAQVALRHGVAVATAEALSPSSAHADRIRLSFAGPEDDLREGVRRLATAWRSL